MREFSVPATTQIGPDEAVTDYLAANAPGVWTAGPVDSWPEEYPGEAAPQTSGVVDAVTLLQHPEHYARLRDGDALVNYGYVDDIIEPARTREHISRSLEILSAKRTIRPAKKHGLIPL